ncbi:MAG: hypothetical protein R3320_03945, partial [Nitriliruptorales bacterium]|nr:hypothetical protein [Nitriliruptorales bacterium]
VYDPGSAPWTPSADRLAVLVEQAIDSVRTAPRSARELVQGIADAADMTGTRWMVLALVWMVAFAGLMPLAFASIGSSLEIEIEIFEDEAPAVQEQPADTSTSNPSVEGSGS